MNKNYDCMNEIFESLTNEERKLLTDNKSSYSFKNGEYLLKQGQRNDYVFYIHKGLLVMQVEYEGDFHLISFVKKQRFAGLLQLSEKEIPTYSLVALTDGEYCLFNMNDFRTVMKQNGEFAFSICCQSVLSGINIAARMAANANKDGKFKLSVFLKYLSVDLFESANFILPFSVKQIAQYLAISERSTYRFLNELELEGLISKDKNNITVHDFKNLKFN